LWIGDEESEEREVEEQKWKNRSGGEVEEQQWRRGRRTAVEEK